jgi:beta-lactamase superfamily II metal-dependent hydrolase
MMRTVFVLAAWLSAQAAMAQAAKTLDIYFVDVEGGQSTLIVTPAGESFLVDAGWGGANGRDAKRIMSVARDAGVSQIDYLMVTHFHNDHDGGVPELSRLIPIRTFIDYGEATEKGKKVQEPYDEYARVRRKGVHIEPKVGDKLPLKGIDVQVVSGRGKTLTEPLSGGGENNPACSAFAKRANDFTENSRSLGFRLVYGSFTFLDLGDLVWNELGQLACPRNMLGHADVYLMAHHGNAFAGVPALTAGVRPRVVIMNNGETKGGDAKTFTTLHGLEGLEDLWQLHRSANKGTAAQADEKFIANLSEDTAYRLKLSAGQDGSFSITNARTGFTKRYDAK